MALPIRLFSGFVCVVTVSVALAQAAAPLVGRSVQSVIDELRAAGSPFVYSTNLVPPSLRVTAEPRAAAPLALAREILAPHGLAVREEGQVWLVVRGERPSNADPPRARAVVTARAAYAGSTIDAITVQLDATGAAAAESTHGRVELGGLAPGRHVVTVRAEGFLPQRVTFAVPSGGTAEVAAVLVEVAPKLDEFIVTASRYDVSSRVQPSATYFSRDEIESLGTLGDDTVRVAQHLPGVTSNEFSARPYVRGGAANELAIVLDGMRLVEPYHLRDFQAVFSAVDQRVVDSVAVHAGGFPAAYGDALSALMVIEPREPAALAHELGVSVLYTSLLSSGRFADGAASWLVSVRNSNLDRVLADELGEPSYGDSFVRITSELSDRHALIFGFLGFNDDIELTLGDEPDDDERAASDTNSRQLWLRLESQWNAKLSSSMSAYTTQFDSWRRESVADLDEIVGSVDDQRAFDTKAIKQVWRYDRSDRQQLSFGLEAERREAAFRYASSAVRRGLLATLGGTAPPSRSLTLEPAGESYGVYVEDRVRITDRVIADLGLRWDRHTYLPPGLEGRFSPRASLLVRLDSRTDLRVSHGRFFQAENLLDLQIEDGVTAYSRAQRAAHTIVSLERRFASSLALRAEAYRKWTRDARPRYENLFDPLVLMPELRASRVLVAPERAEARGVELLVSGERPVSWWAGMSLAHTDDLIDGVLVPRGWDQHQALDAGVSWPLAEWTLSGTLTLHRGWPVTRLSVVTDSSGASSAVAGPRNASRLGNVARLDARATREFRFGGTAVRFYAELTNLTDRNNPCCLVYEPAVSESGAPSLNAVERARVGLTGNIGVRWEF
jgi:outer membrane receptor protein involved in Fe transport